MLKKIKNQFRKQRKSELKGTPDEEIRDSIIKAGLEAAKESGSAIQQTS